MGSERSARTGRPTSDSPRCSATRCCSPPSDYDAELADVDEATLQERTLATIKRFAATNRLAGGDDWGRQLFWDSTFELYFVLAARLLWADLDDADPANVQTIAAGQAAYAYGLAFADDPMSGGWTPNGTNGGWLGDTKLEEMGVYAQAIAPGLAWGRDDAALRDRFLFWTANASALPVADRANLARVDGVTVDERSTAHNLHDTFIVENHDSANPHYQAELWRDGGPRGDPLPGRRPAAARGAAPPAQRAAALGTPCRLLASDAGEPVMPMVADRYHLYGRDVLPLAFLAQVQGDRDAARAEADLAERLEPYLRHEPEYRLTKFSGEEKYEPEARAELAISYLFHRHRGTPVRAGEPGGVLRPGQRHPRLRRDVGLTASTSPSGRLRRRPSPRPASVRFLLAARARQLADRHARAGLPAGRHRLAQRHWTSAWQREPRRPGRDRHRADVRRRSTPASPPCRPARSSTRAPASAPTRAASRCSTWTCPACPG